MLLHKLRERAGARFKGEGEAGFTLVELLVVMLILGILAAIAIPAFFNQKEKANDSQAKAYAHSAQVAMETFATDNGGSYTGANVGALTTIEPTLTGAGGNLNPTVQGPQAYTIAVTSPVTEQRVLDHSGRQRDAYLHLHPGRAGRLSRPAATGASSRLTQS